MKVLVVDVGGTHVKILASGHKESREFPSGPTLTARRMPTRRATTPMCKAMMRTVSPIRPWIYC